MATLQDLKNFYSENPHYFARAAEGVLHDDITPPHRRVHAYVRSLEGKTVCDFGCGSGNDIERMYAPANRYVGVDVSQGALREARRRFAPANVVYQEMDFEGPIPLPDSSCDVVTSFFVFEHVLDPTGALDEMTRILKQGGELFLLTPNFGSPLKTAPALGTPSKVKLAKKSGRMLKTMLRRLFFPRAPLDLSMIPFEKMDLSDSWGPDMDATNEPWSWELARYLSARGFDVSVSTWETPQRAHLKTGPERALWPLRHIPIIRHFGTMCFLHATKI